MKRKLALITLVLTFIIIPSYAGNNQEDDGEWYPFVIPAKLDPDSPANIGKLVLDAPAGKHGFCKVKDGHFYFEDGTRARFWGTNLCFQACFPTHKQAELIADRLAFFGFNAVRFAHLDYYFEPNGIFEDVCPAFDNPQMKRTGILSKKQLDKLDYLIYQLKIRGIYVDFILLCSRFFTEADGIANAKELGMAAKPVSMFDSKLIELQKQFAKDLLTHYNPYTKLRYCDDPAIAIIEITNENSIVSQENKIPQPYKNTLENLWQDWHRTKKGSRKEFLVALEKQYFDEMVKFLKKELNIQVPIAGSQYSSLEALSACDFIDTHAYWDHPQFPNKPWDKDDFRIHNKSLLRDKNLSFINSLVTKGRETAQHNKPFAVTEWNHCYPNEYAYETPLLLASTAANEDWDALFQFAFSHDMPLILNRVHNYFDIAPNTQQLLLCSLGSVIFLTGQKPNVTLKSGSYTISAPLITATIDNIENTPLGTTITLFKDKSEILYLIGKIKSRNSGWNDQKRFTWGISPILLQSIRQESASCPWVEIPKEK